MEESVLLLSGGLDSMVLLAHEMHEGRKPLCISFDYQQRHREQEIGSAALIAKYYRVIHKTVLLPKLYGSALTGDGNIPKGLHYTDPQQSVTVVPNRNAILLAHAASIANHNHLNFVLFAAHAGDAAVYTDCRQPFISAMDKAIFLACGVHIKAPYLLQTKKDIVNLGRKLGVDFDLSWSCYDPQNNKPCLSCGACIERQEAML